MACKQKQWSDVRKPKADIRFYFVTSYSTSQFPILLQFLLYLKIENSSRIKQIPINDPIDEFNFLFLIPFLARAPFLGFSSYLVKRKVRVPRAVS